MWMWIALAAVQLVFLPGFLIVRALRLDGANAIQTLTLCFGLSLLANHFLVVGLVLTGLYTRPALLVAMALEGTVALVLLRSRTGADRGSLGDQVRDFLAERPGRGSGALLVGAVATVGYLAAFFVPSATHAFRLWDSIVSWNRWALDWSHGTLPGWTMHYPQLLPSNWSLAYVLQGQDLQFLPHGLMALFPVGIGLLLLDLGLRRREESFLLAAPVFAVLLGASLSRWIGSGHADLPVTFMGLLAVYPLLWGRLGDDPASDRSRVTAAALAVAGCALTKQGGLYLAFVLPILFWVSTAGAPRSARLRACARMAAIAAVLIAPWYVYVELQVLGGHEGNELATTLTGAHAGRSPWERALAAPSHLGLPPLLLWVAALLTLVSSVRGEAVWPTRLIAVPLTLIWAFFFSYGPRNLAPALPFLAVSIAGGALVVRRALGGVAPLRPGPVRVAAALAAAAVAFWSVVPDDARLAAIDREQRLGPGNRELNELLMRYQEERGFKGRVLTNYRHFWNLPGIGDRVFVDHDAPASEFWPYRTDAATFARIAEDPANAIGYLLLTAPVPADISAYVLGRLETGAFKLVFDIPDARMVRIERRGASGR
ncbi:MAG: hypothetical protein ACQGVK_13245 [Myxococcota bacterium]